MRIHVISDVHGAAGPLRSVGQGVDLVICLGDLVAFTDYASPGSGVMGRLLGVEVATEYIRLRTAGRFEEASAYAAYHWRQRTGDRDALIRAELERQYDEVFGALPEPALLTYGNVDLPQMWPARLAAGHRVCQGEVVEVAGVRIGFVGGGLPTRYRTPYEIAEADHAQLVDGLGAVDILCCHIPPALPEITYDTVARRFERGSAAVLEYIRRWQPSLVLHGHVHQPLRARQRVGRTECINVGHFAATGRPHLLTWSEGPAFG